VLLMVKPPVNVFAPLKVTVPLVVLVALTPLPPRIELQVPLCRPYELPVNVPVPEMVPPKSVTAPTVSLNPFMAKVPETVTADVSGMTPAAPNVIWPPEEIIVAPFQLFPVLLGCTTHGPNGE
jgi:hypothetical protein